MKICLFLQNSFWFTIRRFVQSYPSCYHVGHPHRWHHWNGRQHQTGGSRLRRLLNFFRRAMNFSETWRRSSFCQLQETDVRIFVDASLSQCRSSIRPDRTIFIGKQEFQIVPRNQYFIADLPSKLLSKFLNYNGWKASVMWDNTHWIGWTVFLYSRHFIHSYSNRETIGWWRTRINRSDRWYEHNWSNFAEEEDQWFILLDLTNNSDQSTALVFVWKTIRHYYLLISRCPLILKKIGGRKIYQLKRSIVGEQKRQKRMQDVFNPQEKHSEGFLYSTSKIIHRWRHHLDAIANI